MDTSLSGNKNGYDERIALGASLFVHALLFLVLSSGSNYNPTLGRETRIDLLWLMAAPAAPAGTDASARAPSAPSAPVSRKFHRRATAARAKTPAPPGVFVAPVRPAAGADGAKGMSRAGIPAAGDPGDSGVPPAGEGVKPKAFPAARPQAREATVTGATSPAPPPPAPPMALPRSFAANDPAADKELPPEPGKKSEKAPASAKPAPLTATTFSAAAAKKTGSGESPAHPATGEPPQPTGPERAARDAAPTGATVAKPPAPPLPQPRGLVVASLSGDLKLISAGDAVKISVVFREFPRSRRHRSPSRSQALQLQNISPVCADGPGRTSEAVIGKAGEGVYVFSAEPRDTKAAQARFTLKIYDSGTGRKVAELGRRTITGKSVLAKVLMPEAILWDDDSAFTGSLQDAESTTKFNTQSGLYWKEYDD